MSAPATDGSAVPSVTFKCRTRTGPPTDENPFDWKDVTSEELFKGKRVVLFSLPGAFTPTCSNKQLPGYEKAYDEMLALGVDDVYCLSVNDAFVMRQVRVFSPPSAPCARYCLRLRPPARAAP
jgi:peroxiredoxin